MCLNHMAQTSMVSSVLVLHRLFFLLNVIANPLNMFGKVEAEHRERTQVKNGTSGNFWRFFAC